MPELEYDEEDDEEVRCWRRAANVVLPMNFLRVLEDVRRIIALKGNCDYLRVKLLIISSLRGRYDWGTIQIDLFARSDRFVYS